MNQIHAPLKCFLLLSILRVQVPYQAQTFLVTMIDQIWTSLLVISLTGSHSRYRSNYDTNVNVFEFRHEDIERATLYVFRHNRTCPL